MADDFHDAEGGPAGAAGDAMQRKLADEAARCATICFDPAERARRLAGVGRDEAAPFAVLARNQFVPLSVVPRSADALRHRAGGVELELNDLVALDAHAHALDAGVDAAVAALRAGDSHDLVRAACQSQPSWPAVGLAASEAELRELLVLQFERMRRGGIAWRGVTSGIYSVPTPDGLFVVIDFYWRAA